MPSRKRRRYGAAACLALVLLGSSATSAPPSQGGEFKLRRATIDAGGQASVAPGYLLRGTIGQPDTGEMAGPDFRLRGGFWTPKGPSDGVFSDGFE